MTEAKWLACEDPEKMLRHLESHVPLEQDSEDDPFHTPAGRKLRLFSIACCRRVEHLLPDERSRKALDVLERYLDRDASKRQFNRAVESAAKVTCDLADAPGGVYEAATAVCSALEDIQDDFEDAREVAIHARSARTEALPQDEPARGVAKVERSEKAVQANFLRDIFGNPFRPVAFAPDWQTDTAVALARQMHESRDFSAMPILADALQDAGCEAEEVLNHCRSGVHVRGCWVVDLVLGKE